MHSRMINKESFIHIVESPRCTIKYFNTEMMTQKLPLSPTITTMRFY